MENQSIDSQYQNLCRLILKGQWTSAFKKLHKLTAGTSDQQLTGRLETLESGYQAAIQFFVAGGVDDQDQDLYRETQRRLLRLASSAARDRKLRTGMNIFSVSHLEQTANENGNESLGLMEEIMLQLAETPEENERRFGLYDSLFNYIFTSSSIADDDAMTQLTAMIASMDETLQAYLVSALTLSCYTFFCDRKMEMLCRFAAQEKPLEVRARALVGIMMVYNRFHRQVALFPRLTDCLTEVTNQYADDFNLLYQEWVTTCCTEELHRIFEEKLLPSLMKESIIDQAKINTEGTSTHVIKIDASNPNEVADPNRRSAIIEFIRLLRHGADTNYNTFKQMKRFDFFMVLGHWLLPFCPNHPLVKRAAVGINEDFCNGIMLGTNMCPSDMYSMCSMLSLAGVQARENMFRSMTNQIKFDEDMDEDMHQEALHEAISQMLDLRRRMRGYLQDLYRLVTINPSKNEIENPFVGSGLYMAPFWKPMLNESKFLLSAAAYYSGIEKHSEAIELLRRYLKLVPFDEEALYMLGNEYIKNETLRPAAECFRRSILAGGDEVECLKRLSHCLMQTRNYSALDETLDRLIEICPEYAEARTMKATALMRSGQYNDALTYFRAIELIDENPKMAAQAARGAAWCLFCMHRYDKALAYYDRFIDNGDVRHEDLLNRGHVLWALGRTQEAADSYVSHIRLFADSCKEGKAEPLNVFDGDVPDLIAITHVHPHQVAMMRDYLVGQL